MYNGLALMWDYETGSYWDHITGEAVHGPLQGAKLNIWGIEITTVAAALAEYDAPEFHRSTYASLQANMMSTVLGMGKGIVHSDGSALSKIMTLRGFRRTMQEVDDRLPEMTQGLGLFEGDQAVFYPLDRIPHASVCDIWQGRPIVIHKGKIDRFPFAVYEDDESERPMQLLMRWYGFCLTFANARIFGEEGENDHG